MSGQRRIAVVTDDAAALPPEWVFPPAGGTAGADVAGQDPERTEGAADASSVLTDEDERAVARSGRPGLAVAAMPVSVDDTDLDQDRDDWLAVVEEALAAGRSAVTSRPSPGQLLRQYRQLEAQGYEGIVSVHCSAQLSGSATSARIASAAVGIPVEIVDSRTIAMAEGRGVMEAWEAAGTGADLAETAEAARAGSAASQLLLWVPGLDALRRGGRIPPSVAALGSMLQVRPVLRLVNGQLAIAELPMTEQRARTRLLRRAGRALRDSTRDVPEVTVHHLLDDHGQERAEEFAEQLVAEHCPDARVRCVPMPAVLGAHAGAGALGVIIHG
ncbi:MAG: DegV family protein [Micrococcales bacterium]|nr:DegV family protein [Micrococcales bacterium]